jgi:hypothetical protein
MSLSAMAGSIIGNVKLRPRLGSRPLVVMGMVSSGGGLLYLTRLQPESGYWADIFPALVVAGIGLGIVASSALNGATLGVSTSDAGVASATVNAMQQIGGSLGVAVLSTVALTATSDYLVAHHSRNAIASAMVHGYTVAFSWAVAFFAVGAVLAGLLYTKMVRTELPVSAVGRPEIELLSSKE